MTEQVEWVDEQLQERVSLGEGTHGIRHAVRHGPATVQSVPQDPYRRCIALLHTDQAIAGTHGSCVRYGDEFGELPERPARGLLHKEELAALQHPAGDVEMAVGSGAYEHSAHLRVVEHLPEVGGGLHAVTGLDERQLAPVASPSATADIAQRHAEVLQHRIEVLAGVRPDSHKGELARCLQAELSARPQALVAVNKLFHCLVFLL